MTLKVLAAVVAALVMVAPASAQVDRHRGKVVVESTAGDAFVTPGGIVAGAASDPSGNVVDIRASADGTGSGGAIRISRAVNDSYLIINADDDGAGGVGFIQAGDSGAYRPLKLNPLGGPVYLPNGTVGGPALAFINEPTSGFYWDNLASGGFNVAVGSTKAARFAQGVIEVPSNAYGTGGSAGSRVIIGRNTSGGGAPGQVWIVDKNNATWVVHVDSAGVLRIGGNAVTEVGGDAVGTVVGTQTSTRASKAIAGEVTNTAAAMAVIRATPVYQFTYKSGAYNGETFFGIVTDDSPLFGMDAGKSFNPVTAFGATVLALRDLDARVAALEARR